MLDQNTDRMWYVIGAVLIGAAIIFGMNTLMPETFASVGDMMVGVTDDISAELSFRSPNANQNLYSAGNYYYTGVAGGSGVTIGDNPNSLIQTNIEVEPNTTYELIYHKNEKSNPMFIITQDSSVSDVHNHNWLFSRFRSRQIISKGSIVSDGRMYFQFTTSEDEHYVSLTSGNVGIVDKPLGEFEVNYRDIVLRKVGN